MPNIERINKLITFMEDEKHPWDINDLDCCFIGQVEMCFTGIFAAGDTAEFLAVPYSHTYGNDCLFMPPNYDYSDSAVEYPRARAISQLKHIVETGKVDWAATPLIDS